MSATSSSSTTSRDPRKPAGGRRAGGCRASTSRAARRRPGRAGGTGCTMRCASATRCGRAAGTAASASSTCPTSRSRRRVGSYNYHPLFPEPTHTVMPVPERIGGRRIALAIDEEDQAQSASEEEARRGRAHACILTFDVTDLADIKPLGQFQVSELDSPFSRTPRRALRRASVLRAHVRHASCTRSGSAAACASSTSPIRCRPREVGHFIPEPVAGRPRAAEQRRGARRARADLRGRPPRRLRRAGVRGIALMAPQLMCEPRKWCAPSPLWGRVGEGGGAAG